MTGDGRADVVAARPDGTLFLYTNSGSDTAPYGTGAPIGGDWQQFSHVTLADVTGDGRADLVAARPDGTLFLYTNSGSDSGPYGTGAPIGGGWQQFNRIMATDVTGDDRADILATRPDGTLVMYTNSGSNSGPYGTGAPIGGDWQQFIGVLAGDVSGDGRADLLAILPDGTLLLYANNGNNAGPYGTGFNIGGHWQQFA